MNLQRTLLTVIQIVITASFAAAASPDSIVTFSEIQYNPPGATEDGEWIELHNQMAINVDMSGWELRGGVDYTFPANTIVAGGDYILVEKVPTAGFGPFTGGLNNGGDTIRLHSNSGRMMDEISFADADDWPVAADGSGVTLAKRRNGSTSGDAPNWAPSLQVGGTPGAENFPSSATPANHTLVATRDTWKYDDSGAAPPANWKDIAFNDASWSTGDAVLGTDAGGATSLTVTANLVQRFRASDITGTANGATPSTWPDTAGTAQSASAVGNPTFRTNATPTGKAVLRFDGNDQMRTSTAPGIGATDGFVYFIVLKANGAQSLGGTADGGGAYIFDRDAAVGNPLVSLKPVGGNTYGFQKRYDNGSGLGGPASSSTLSTSDFQIVALRRNPAQSRFEIWVDGVMEGSESDSGAGLTPQPIVIANHHGGAGGFSGDIAEILIYSDELSDSDFQLVGSYLESEYGLDTNFPGSTVATPLATAPSTYYFRKSFNFPGNPSLTSVRLEHVIADGTVFYLNGVEIHRENMPVGAITHGTPASSIITEPQSSGFFTIPSTALVNGTNALTAEVHKATGGTNATFTASLAATEQPPNPNQVPGLILNEIAAANGTSFWIELINPDTSPADIGGFIISVNGDPAKLYTLPAQTLPGGGILSLTEAQLGFRPLAGDRIFLYTPGSSSVSDAQVATNKTRGRSPSHPGKWLFPSADTPGAPNTFSFNSDIVINEICYHAPPIQATPESFTSEPLLAFADTWRYNEAGDNLGATWAQTTHNAGGNWESGPGAHAFDTSGISLPIGTPLTFPGANNPYVITYYFEREFELTQSQFNNLVSFNLTHFIDDGAVFYINGVEATRFKMNPGIVSSSTTASVGGEAVITGPVTISSSAAVVGTNRISVEVHQNAPGSSDIVFALELAANIGTQALPFRKSDEQWLEIFNRGASPVDLTGWNFADGISITFPNGLSIASGEHIVITNNLASLAAKHPAITIAGEFSGSLSGSGERITLRDASNNPVDEVRYYDGGNWPETADGGGTSLERRDPDSDSNAHQSWVASDESADTQWKTYSYQGTVSASAVGPDNQWNDFVIGLLDAGEILIDDIMINGALLTANSNFENGDSAWRFRGNHRHSEIIPDPDNASNHVLKIVASGYSEHMHNNIETTRAISNGTNVTISFKARWVSGSNQLHTRFYFNRLPKTTIVDRPNKIGTPGVANSTLETNIGPTYENLSHFPVVPAPGEPVTISVTPSDPDGIASLTLFYSVESGAFNSLPMPISGEAQIPGQSAGQVVQFYVQATDVLGAISFFPASGAESGAMYEVQDNRASTTGLHNFRIIMKPADDAFMHTNIHLMSNEHLPCTVIYNESEVYYDAGVRLKSSQRGRPVAARVGFNVEFNNDQLFRGVHRTVAIDRSEGQNPGQREMLFNIMMTSAGGASGKFNDFIKVIAPRNAHTGSAELQLARYGSIFLDSQFENGADGTVFEYELIYYPTTADANGYKIPAPDSVIGTNIQSLGADKENYRWNFLIKGNRDHDNYAPFLAYAAHFDKSGAAFHQDVEKYVDVDNWLRGMAFCVLSGAGDNYGANSQHNGHFYMRPDGRGIFLPHDMDFAFSTTGSITANSDVATIVNDPVRLRQYYGHLHDIITTTYNNSYMSQWSTHFAALDPAQGWAGSLSHINSRSNNVLSQINNIPSIAFNITTANSTVASSPATLVGDGWVNVREIRLAGSTVPLNATWTDNNTWTLAVPVATGANPITLEAIDFQGNIVGTGTVTITNTQIIDQPSSNNIAISELNYHPADPTAAELNAGFIDSDQFEFIEIKNIGANDVDLTGTQFNSGISFIIPSGTLIPSGGYVLVVQNANAFANRYPSVPGAIVIGEYQLSGSAQLANSGEQIALVDTSGADIQRFTYNDKHPWPAAADGDGFSLVLINPDSSPNHSLPINWRLSTATNGNPGASDATTFAGNPNADNDQDGISALMEYALGTSDAAPNANPTISSSLQFSHTRNLASDDVTLQLEISPDLTTWTSVTSELTFINESPAGNGTSTITWQGAPTSGQLFIRLKASL
jgi:hypothetical protein